MHIQETKNNLSEFRESLSDRIHQRACEAASQHRKVEAELIEVLQQVEQHRVFLARGHSSLFLYVVKELGLSESVAFNLISVARKAYEVPELKVEIAKGAITLSNARKIVPVLTKENKTEWLGKARELSHRQLEKEVVKIRPQLATPERATYVTPSRVRLELGLSEKDMLKLRRVQDLFCQTRRWPVTLEEVLVALTDDFLKRNDPLERAKRQQVRKGLQRGESGFSKESSCEGESDYSKIPAEPSTSKVDTAVFASVREIESARCLSETVKAVARQAEYVPETRAEGSTRARGANDSVQESRSREPISARLLHQINLRDLRRCQFIDSHGKKCGQTRWTEIHHLKPVSKGGMNTVENLRTLCSAHHRWIHLHGGH